MKTAHLIAALSILLLSSCASKAPLGAAAGAGAGAIAGQAIGHNTESTLIGAAVGGMLGYMIGNEWDKYDQRQLNQAYEHSRSGQPTAWVNPDNGNQYQVTPQPAYQGPGNQSCRKAEVVAQRRGESKRDYVTACRDGNGNWNIQ